MTFVPTSATTPGQVVRQGLALVRRFVRMHPGLFALAVSGALVFVTGIVAAARVVGWATDAVIVPLVGRGAADGSRLWAAAGLIVGVGVWKAAGIVLRRSFAGHLQSAVQADLRTRLIRHQLRLSLPWLASRTTGDLLSVSDNDTRMATFVLAPLPFATGVVFLLVGAIAAVTWTDPWMGLLAVVVLLTVTGLDMRGSYRTFEAFEDVQHRRGEVARVAHESFDGAVTVKALGREDVETARFRAATDDLRDHLIAVGRIWTGYRALTEGLPHLGVVLLVVLGVFRIAAGAMTPGELVFVTYLVSLLALPIRMFGYLMWDVAQGTAAMRRVDEVLDAPDVVRHGELTAVDNGTPATVDGRRMRFGYDPAVPVLHGVDLQLAPGRTIAVVGPTGSGKSSLTLLLARLWDLDEGVIRLDGRDLRELAPGVLPREVAYVSQEAFLFDDTVRGNLTLGHPASDAEVEAAARLAAAHDFVMALPAGYDTVVGERGTTLSGGQRQRLALARALLRRPRLLILDDATSAVDPSVETRILRGLAQARMPTTVLIVAYRRSSITLADEVVYLEDGRIVAQGRHADLLDRVAGYAALLRAYDEDRAARAATGARP